MPIVLGRGRATVSAAAAVVSLAWVVGHLDVVFAPSVGVGGGDVAKSSKLGELGEWGEVARI